MSRKKYAASIAALGLLSSLAVTPIAQADTGSSIREVVNSITSADTSGKSSSSSSDEDLIEIPQGAPINIDFTQHAENGDRLVTFLRGLGIDGVDGIDDFISGSSDLSESQIVQIGLNLVTNVIERIGDIISSPGDGSSNGSSNGGSSNGSSNGDSSNGDDGDEPTVPSGDEIFEAIELPDFLTVTKDGLVVGDTTGVKPGTYRIVGHIIGPDGETIDTVEFSFRVGDDSGDGDGNNGGSGDNNGSDGDGGNGSGNNDGSDGDGGNGSGDNNGSDDDGGNGSGDNNGSDGDGGNGSGNDNGSDGGDEDEDEDEDGGSVTGDVKYSDVTLKAGESKTVKPEGNTEDYVFMSNVSRDVDWVDVSPDGTVELTPGTGVSAGDVGISVSYIERSKVGDLLASGDKSNPDLKTTEFTAHVERDTSNADSSESTGGNSNSGGGSTTGSTNDGDQNRVDSGYGDESGGMGATVDSTNGGDGVNAGTSGGEAIDDRAQPVQNSAEEPLPVTGLSAQSLAQMSIAALAMIALAGTVLVQNYRRERIK